MTCPDNLHVFTPRYYPGRDHAWIGAGPPPWTLEAWTPARARVRGPTIPPHVQHGLKHGGQAGVPLGQLPRLRPVQAVHPARGWAEAGTHQALGLTLLGARGYRQAEEQDTAVARGQVLRQAGDQRVKAMCGPEGESHYSLML